MDKEIIRKEHQKKLTVLWAKIALTKKNFIDYINKVHINRLRKLFQISYKIHLS